jgi:hypothetical protein
MGMDIRLPMGVMFVILGAVLVFAGIRVDQAALDQSLGINIDLWWGLVILLFGVVMLLLTWTSGGRKAPPGHEGTI